MNRYLITGLLLSFFARANAQEPMASIRTRSEDPVNGVASPQSFPIVGNAATPLLIDSSDHWLVQKAASWFSTDIQKVTDQLPVILYRAPEQAPDLIIIGSLDASPLIQRLAAAHLIRVETLKGKWESYTYQVILHPFKGVGRALVIAGSDKRGTAYGVLELSRQMGVSPWYWWADVPVRKQASLYLQQHTPYFSGSPGVKYRGIFINDEAPAFSGWTRATFGGVNHGVYEHMFELLLRLKANFLWPAMWGNAFNDDDTLNPILADKYGIVMSTSHHEPMMRAQQEWKRYGKGDWNYETNGPDLRDFWRKGIEHMGNHESIITVGMRGDGDKPMSEGSNISLLERIVSDQRKIIGEVTGKNPADVPQVWALYKEVQDYYDKGMRVPDDVTLLLCDDNWGNIRRLPLPGSPHRKGGYGIYYHFDYVGGPRNYKWLNTNSIARTWEQMHLAYENDVRRIWVVNVGDLKPMEYPISFFLDYAWDPSAWDVSRVEAYAANWASEQFGPLHAVAIGHLLAAYTEYNSRRKPELLSPDTYSLVDYREAERVTAQYDLLRSQAEALYRELPAEDKDAYYELVLFPIQACANANDLYVSAARNSLYAAQGRAAANAMADSVRSEFAEDSILSYTYNHDLAGGKWVHMMDQTHIGYTNWQEPRHNTMPKVATLALPEAADMGVAVEGSDAWWGEGAPARIADTMGGAALPRIPMRTVAGDPAGFEGPHGQMIAAPRAPESTPAALPGFSVYLPQRHYIDIFNRGTTPFDYTISTSAPWIKVSSDKGQVSGDERIWVTVDAARAPAGRQEGSLTVSASNGKPIVVGVSVQGRLSGLVSSEGSLSGPVPSGGHLSGPVPSGGFVESNGYVAMDAAHFTGSVAAEPIRWVTIPGIGKAGTGVTPFPVTAPPQTPGLRNNTPHLEYTFYLFDTGTAHIQLYCSPTLSYYGEGGRRLALSVDDGVPVILRLPAEQEGPVWNKMVADNIAIVTRDERFSRPGAHILRYWMVDPGVVLQKIVVDLGGAKPCYLGPPETPMNAGLKDYFRDDFPVGVAVSPRSLTGPDAPLILQQFNSLTPENVMKMQPIHPEENRYNFGEADSIVAFAQAHGLRVRGHNLCWHQQAPAWLFKDAAGNPVTKDVLLRRLKDHITTVVSRYKGKVYAWDVVNEAISDDSTQFLRNSPWYQICGEDFIRKAFEYAHAADPGAQLFYNDYNTERPEKRERVYRLLKELLDEGVPINGIGLQAHWSVYEPSGKDLRDAIERFSSLGLKIQVTELDISVYPWEKNMRNKQASDNDAYTAGLRQKQSAQYARVFDIFREYRSVITGVTFWNVTDRHTWLDEYPVPGRKNYPLLFDTEGQPKEAYWEVTGQ